MTPFWYDLPADRIAARPVRPYDAAKLLAVNRKDQSLQSSVFYDLPKFLTSKDILVFNNSRVIKSRLFGRFEESGGELEVLILERTRKDNEILAKAMGRPLKRFKQGKILRFSPELIAQVKERIGSDTVSLRFSSSTSDISDALQRAALMPIPPYIRSGIADEEDELDYQTCFAKIDGAIAAPTASLHFTPELMQKITAVGISTEFLTLHVGRASFSTLWEPDQQELTQPGPERYRIDSALVERLQRARGSGGRVVAVGTTVVRALESMIRAQTQSEWIETELFITPGFKFELVDALITNFHQPGTTHLLLVEAFMGKELLEKSYNHALQNKMRFLSYGDGMLIEKRHC